MILRCDVCGAKFRDDKCPNGCVIGPTGVVIEVESDCDIVKGHQRGIDVIINHAVFDGLPRDIEEEFHWLIAQYKHLLYLWHNAGDIVYKQKKQIAALKKQNKNLRYRLALAQNKAMAAYITENLFPQPRIVDKHGNELSKKG